jgi:hypothetical protein
MFGALAKLGAETGRTAYLAPDFGLFSRHFLKSKLLQFAVPELQSKSFQLQDRVASLMKKEEVLGKRLTTLMKLNASILFRT